ncbi:MAG: putative photosynthetic complex assembly protein PuhE [Steroidobacteraceae bacterium]|jgi:putative photosynthetic complex assembly protein 2
MVDFVMPAAYAVLVWWFATGIILFLDGLPPHTFRWSMICATGGLTIVAMELHSSAADMSLSGAYTAFTCAILVWGWLEMSFLMGFITGPRKHACLERCSGWRHFLHAVQAIIFNELATLAGGLTILAATRHAPNQLAFETYVILWAMRLSAKLNLFLGVPNLGEKFLPTHLQYLKSFFRKRPMNILFPVSVSLSTIGVVLLVQRYVAVADPFQMTAYALMASLLALAVLEHWFMVIPLPSEKMWKWAMRPAQPRIPAKAPQTLR